MGGQGNRFYEFGPFRSDTRELLLRNGEPVSLAPKVYDTLLTLVENSGRIIRKEELMKAVWPDTFVEEANLTVNISARSGSRRVSGSGRENDYSKIRSRVRRPAVRPALRRLDPAHRPDTVNLLNTRCLIRFGPKVE